MKPLKSIVYTTVFVISILGCTKEEDANKSIQPIFVEFISFKIITNEESSFQTETFLNTNENSISLVTEHGVELFFGGALVERFNQGSLVNLNYKTPISSKMSKGFTYSVRPFVIIEGKEYFGELVDFVSQLDIKIEINNIFPLTGFAMDTVVVTGKNFCNPNNGAGNVLILGDFYQKIISETDSVIKGVISPNANKSIAKFNVESCRIVTPTEFEFVFNPPELDSISSKEYYIGEKSKVYCKNLHPAHTKIWLDDIEVEINKDRDSIIDLEFFIPKNLPAGKLDFKMKVIDRIVELKEVYQSTSPEIIELDKLNTGFLDTITIKGNYLVQPNNPTKIIIGEREQTIVSQSSNEIKVVIDKYFQIDQPKLQYQSGEFEIERDIKMLPPEIISFDKERYNLQDEVVRVKTKYFLGTDSNIKVGEQYLSSSYPFGGVDENGFIDLSLNDWLELNRYPDFVFDEAGQIQVSISTHYGNDKKNISIYAPFIESVNQNNLYYGETLVIEGDNFGYKGVCNVYINDTKVEATGLSNQGFGNQKIFFPIPDIAEIGKNTLKVNTGGQGSNIVEFKVIEVLPNGLSNSSGTRKDVFEVNGQNLTGKIYANGSLCEIIESSQNSIKFQLPYYNLLNEPSEITLTYGPHTYNIGTINGIEPYKLVENYQPIDIFFGFTSFEYQGEFYMVTHQGIYKLNLSAGNWEQVESNMADIHSNHSKRRKGSFSNGKLYFPSSKSFQVYDLTQKEWINDIVLNIADDLDILYATVSDDIAYIISSSNGLQFYAYDINTNEIINLSQPKYFPSGGSGYFNNFKSFNDNLYLELFGTIQMFDISNNSWKEIGHPDGYSYRQWTNIYEYQDMFYFSGGLYSASITYHDLHVYDLNTGQWSEKTYLPSKLSQHAVYGQNDQLYFFSGDGEFRYDNLKMFEYNIQEDPY